MTMELAFRYLARRRWSVVSVAELRRWVMKQPASASVFIDEDGLTLVCEENESYLEVGGDAEPDHD